MSAVSRERWAIVLAAGEGSRLRSLTAGFGGHAVPKQFCSLTGGESLLRRAIRRAERSVPAERVMVVVAAQHRSWWRPEVVDLPPENVLVQPHNRGTAAGILFALRHVAGRGAGGDVAVLPSDHWVEREWTLQAALEQAFRALAHLPDRLLLLGMTPTAPEADLGWILPTAAADRRVQDVLAFREKPPPVEAARLQREGGLVNTFLFVVGVQRLLRLFDEHLPELVAAMGRLASAGAPRAAGYAALPAADFSRHLLQAATPALGVLAVPPCGWSDLGTPERVARCVAGIGQRAIVSGAGSRPGGPRRPSGRAPVLAERLARDRT